MYILAFGWRDNDKVSDARNDDRRDGTTLLTLVRVSRRESITWPLWKAGISLFICMYIYIFFFLFLSIWLTTKSRTRHYIVSRREKKKKLYVYAQVDNRYYVLLRTYRSAAAPSVFLTFYNARLRCYYFRFQVSTPNGTVL